MKLDASDIGYIASGRINSKNKKQTMTWAGISGVAVIAGFGISRFYDQNLGIIISFIAVVAFYLYQWSLDKALKTYKAKLLKEWEGK